MHSSWTPLEQVAAAPPSPPAQNAFLAPERPSNSVRPTGPNPEGMYFDHEFGDPMVGDYETYDAPIGPPPPFLHRNVFESVDRSGLMNPCGAPHHGLNRCHFPGDQLCSGDVGRARSYDMMPVHGQNMCFDDQFYFNTTGPLFAHGQHFQYRHGHHFQCRHGPHFQYRHGPKPQYPYVPSLGFREVNASPARSLRSRPPPTMQPPPVPAMQCESRPLSSPMYPMHPMHSDCADAMFDPFLQNVDAFDHCRGGVSSPHHLVPQPVDEEPAVTLHTEDGTLRSEFENMAMEMPATNTLSTDYAIPRSPERSEPEIHRSTVTEAPESKPIPAMEPIPKDFKREVKLDVDRESPPPDRLRKRFQCEMCKAEWFETEEALKLHIATHVLLQRTEDKRATDPSRAWKCDVCDREFAEKYTLKRHLRIHTKEKPWKCSFCPKAFNQSCSLTAHIRIHTGERPFQCPFCEKRFRQSTHRRQHCKRIHREQWTAIQGADKK